MVHDPVTTGLGVALISADIFTPTLLTNPFGLAEPEPSRSINIAVGLTEIGILAAQSLWGGKKKRRRR